MNALELSKKIEKSAYWMNQFNLIDWNLYKSVDWNLKKMATRNQNNVIRGIESGNSLSKKFGISSKSSLFFESFTMCSVSGSGFCY
jgi:hypothetical protein